MYVYIYINNFEKYFISSFLSTVHENYKIAKLISHCTYMTGLVYVYNFEKYYISAYISTVQENNKIAKLISHFTYTTGCSRSITEKQTGNFASCCHIDILQKIKRA